MKVGAGVEIGSLAGEFANWAGVESVYEISGEADLVAVHWCGRDGRRYAFDGNEYQLQFSCHPTQ